jgi:hypothetical protein
MTAMRVNCLGSDARFSSIVGAHTMRSCIPPMIEALARYAHAAKPHRRNLMQRKIQLTWLRSWQAYAVRIEHGRMAGLVRCRMPHLPFKREAEFLHT